MNQEYLKERLTYHAATGLFVWNNGRNVGKVAGGLTKDGYIQIQLKKKYYLAHTLVWLYVYGEWFDGDIDHENLLKHDNRLDNLRAASKSENQCNRSAQQNNQLGIKGLCVRVLKDSSVYVVASVCRNRQIKSKAFNVHKLGIMEATKQASIAASSLRHELHGSFACH